MNSALVMKVCKDINNMKVINNKAYYVHPFKNTKCSVRCYLNWVLFDQEPPRFHKCECMKTTR